MLRADRSVIPCALVVGALVLLGIPARGDDPNPRAFAAEGSGPAESATAADPPRPIFLFQDGPIDPEAIRRRLASPDFVILGGAQYDALVRRVNPAAAAPGPPAFVFESVEVRGEVGPDLAQLTAEYGVVLTGNEPVWVPVRLDGQILTRASEGNRDLPVRQAAAGGGWLVELSGRGRYRVAVRLPVPVHADAEGQRLDLAIPPAASTRVRLDLPERATEAWAGPREPLEVLALEDGRRRRVQASLPARDRLVLTWRLAAGPSTAGPPVLSAQGEIALDVDRGTLRTRSTWAVRCDRGQARRLELELSDPDDELLTLELDDQPSPIESVIDLDTGHIAVPLAEPMRPGAARPRRLTLTTRRTLPAGVTTRFSFCGFPIVHALGQSGVVAIIQGEDLWTSGIAGRGLRQINPLTELPDSLRGRPKTVLAYQFIEQPFDLEVRVDPSPPTVRVMGRTVVAVDAAEAVVDAEFDVEMARGRVQELQFTLPENLELTGVGPAPEVASSQVLEGSAGEPGRSARVLALRLAPKTNGNGAFRVRLTGWQAIDPAGPFAVGLFQPRGASARRGKVAVLTARGVAVDLADGGAVGSGPGPFLPLGPETPPDWSWPSGRVPGTPALWLRYDGTPGALPLRATIRPRLLYHETTETVTIDRRRVDLAQTTLCHVRNGSLSRLEVTVPPVLEAQEGRWGLEGGAVIDRNRLGTDPDGGIRYRLTLDREVIDTVELKFWARLPLEPELAHDRPTRIELPRLRLREGAASPAQVAVKADPGIGLEPAGAGWKAVETEDPATREGSAPLRWTWSGPEEGAGPAPLLATAPVPAALPGLVASRLWLRSVRAPDGRLQTDAWYRVEGHRGALSVALPPGAMPVQARVGNDPVEVERLADGAGYRLRLPAELPGPVLVALEYVLPAASVPADWGPPRLLGGGVVQETLWEICIPWNTAVLGVPAGWTDENRWYWDRYVWKRRPWLDEPALANWVGGPSVRGRVSLPGEEEEEVRLGYHGYLFGQPGAPAPLMASVYSRARLVGACSGTVLAVGVLLLLVRPPGRLVWLVGLGLALAIAAAVDRSLTFLALQASAVGIALTVVAALTQRFVERRRPPTGRITDAASTMIRGAPAGPPPGSSKAPIPEVDSDESTVIRRRPPVPRTVDYAPSPEQHAVWEGQASP